MMVIYSISFEIACVGLILTSEEFWMFVVQVCIILIITFLATFSVVTGLRAGLKTMSQITFTLGNILLFSLLFGGFLVHAGNTTMPLHWCFSLSPLSFACEAMMVNEFSDLSIVFNPVGGTTINGTKGSVWLSNFGFNKNNVSVYE